MKDFWQSSIKIGISVYILFATVLLLEHFFLQGLVQGYNTLSSVMIFIATYLVFYLVFWLIFCSFIYFIVQLKVPNILKGGFIAITLYLLIFLSMVIIFSEQGPMSQDNPVRFLVFLMPFEFVIPDLLPHTTISLLFDVLLYFFVGMLITMLPTNKIKHKEHS